MVHLLHRLYGVYAPECTEWQDDQVGVAVGRVHRRS